MAIALCLFVSNGQAHDASEPSVSYAVSQKDSQPANDDNYASLRTTENNPHAYSQISRPYANFDAVPPSGGQYVNVTER